jgi:hypothetical protein
MLVDICSQIRTGYFEFPVIVLRHIRIVVENGYSLLHHRPSAWNNAAPTGRIFMKCDIWDFLNTC